MKIGIQALFIFPFIVAFILSFTFRGFFRALAANQMGDSTGKNHGFLTLNPAAHVDALITVIMIAVSTGMILLRLGNELSMVILLMFFIMFRAAWILEVPINQYNFKDHERGMAYVSLAGIFGYMVMILFSFYAGGLMLKIPQIPLAAKQSIVLFVQHTASLGSWLVVFSLIPIPTSDGFPILEYYFPNTADTILQKLTPDMMMIVSLLILLILFVPALSLPLRVLQALVVQGISMLVFI